jgi:hypothetical protein
VAALAAQESRSDDSPAMQKPQKDFSAKGLPATFSR